MVNTFKLNCAFYPGPNIFFIANYRRQASSQSERRCCTQRRYVSSPFTSLAKGQPVKKVEEVAVVTQDMLRSIREETQKHPTSKAAILDSNEINRMKASTKIETAEMKKQSAMLSTQMRETQLADSNARKARMQAMDRERANKVPPTDIEQQNRNKDVGILSKAQAQLDEELDDVKHMNQMVLYSKVVTIRDKQLQENKMLESEWVEEQKKLDLMMEIERLKGLKVAEEREVLRQQARRKGALVIVD